MYESLEKYIEEIRRHLPLKHGVDEILAEIRSHILEKAESGSGAVTEESLRQAIATYGKPREIAATYLEGQEIISATFKRHLMRYTWMLFAIHAVLTAVAINFHVNIVAFPFFFIPKMTAPWAIIYLPTAFVYDFGLVALFLYIVTQRRKDMRIPWPRLLIVSPARPRLAKPRVGGLVVHFAYFAALLFVLIKFRTIMFYTVNFHHPKPLLAPLPALFYSILLVAALGCHAVAYAVRFLFNSAWVYVVRDAVVLILLWIVWNTPIDPQFVTAAGVDLRLGAQTFILVLAMLAAIRFLRNVQRLRQEMTLP